MIKVLIFGASKGGERVKNIIDDDKVEIVGYLDNDESKHGGYFFEKEIFPVNEIEGIDYDYILIGSGRLEEINKQLLDKGIKKDKIIKIYNLKPILSAGICRELIIKNSFKKKKYRQVIKEEGMRRIKSNYSINNIILRSLL